MTIASTMRRLIADCRGSAAVEMVLVTPLLSILMAGSAELGRYFYQEHVLTKAVRDGAVFAARSDINKFHCDSGAVDAPIPDNTRALVRTGGLSGQQDLLPWWTATSGVTFTVTVVCSTAAGGTTLGGIYTANGGKVPVVTVSATLPYRTMMAAAGLSTGTWQLNATEQAAVQGL
jgi:Flp pilus assembly protein TadG